MLKGALLSTLVVLVAVGPLATIAQSQDGEKQAIQKVIESFGSAINTADLPMLMAHIADDAVIDSRIARGKVSKQKYADAMALAFEKHAIVAFEIRHIKITMIDATRATVLAAIYPMTPAQRFGYDHEWKLEKRDGLWLIVETAYRTKPGEPVKPIELARRAA